MEYKNLLKIGATGLAGLFAGNAMYINAVDHPARMVLDTANCRKVWKESFKRAAKIQGGMCLVGSLAGFAAFYLDSESENRMLWLLGSSAFIVIWPYTVLFMFPDILKNLKDDSLETNGESWVRNHLIRWNKQHGLRTVLSCTAFGIFLYALANK